MLKGEQETTMKQKHLKHKDELPPLDDVITKMQQVNYVLWQEIAKVPKLRRKMERYPDFHLLTGSLFPSVECCVLQFRRSRDESADCDEDGLPITVNHFLRLSDKGYQKIINAIESMGVFDTTEPITLPLKIGGIESYDSPRQDHH